MDSPDTRSMRTLALTAILGLVAFLSYRGGRALTAALSGARDRQADLLRQLSRAERTRLEGTDPKPAASRGKPSPISLFTAEHMREAGLLHSENSILRIHRTTLELRYAPLLHALNLPPEREGRLLDIIGDRMAYAMDLESVAKSQGLSMADPEIADLLRRADADMADGEATLMGPSDYAKLKAFDRVVQVRDMVTGLAGAVAATDPLGADQADRLVAAIAGASEAYASGGPADIADVDWQAVDRLASTILTPGQLLAFKESGGRARAQLEKAYADAVKEESREPPSFDGSEQPGSP